MRENESVWDLGIAAPGEVKLAARSMVFKITGRAVTIPDSYFSN